MDVEIVILECGTDLGFGLLMWNSELQCQEDSDMYVTQKENTKNQFHLIHMLF